MNTYSVIHKETKNVVYSYEADEPIAWTGLDFNSYAHVLVEVSPSTPAPNRVTKYQLIQRMGDAAFAAILMMAKQSIAAEVWVEKFKLLTPDPDGTSIDLSLPEAQSDILSIEAALIAQGVVSAGWSTGVLS